MASWTPSSATQYQPARPAHLGCRRINKAGSGGLLQRNSQRAGGGVGEALEPVEAGQAAVAPVLSDLQPCNLDSKRLPWSQGSSFAGSMPGPASERWEASCCWCGSSCWSMVVDGGRRGCRRAGRALAGRGVLYPRVETATVQPLGRAAGFRGRFATTHSPRAVELARVESATVRARDVVPTDTHRLGSDRA